MQISWHCNLNVHPWLRTCLGNFEKVPPLKLSPIERPAQKERIQGGFGTKKSSAPFCELLSKSRSLFAGVAYFIRYNLKAFDARLKQHNPTFQLYSFMHNWILVSESLCPLDCHSPAVARWKGGGLSSHIISVRLFRVRAFLKRMKPSEKFPNI